MTQKRDVQPTTVKCVAAFQAIREELTYAGFFGYRFCMQTAYEVGESRHPQEVIREWFPDACDLEPVSIAACWMFNTKSVRPDTPEYFIRLEAAWAESGKVDARARE